MKQVSPSYFAVSTSRTWRTVENYPAYKLNGYYKCTKAYIYDKTGKTGILNLICGRELGCLDSCYEIYITF